LFRCTAAEAAWEASVSSGLFALLDDIAGLANVAAASLDDAASQAAKASAKAAGIVIDDAAVTPRYAVGFAADRELPIIWRIALGSLKNKLLILLPAALVLTLVAPWAITPLLMIGGVYLCYEGGKADRALPAACRAWRSGGGW
jgi:predicted DNA repair protein MutK